MTRSRRLLVLVLLGASVVALQPAPAPAVALDTVIATVPKDTYLPDTILATRDGTVTLLNADTADHDVVARVYDDNFEPRPDYVRPDDSAPWCVDFYLDCPLFWSELIPGAGTTTRVLGFEDAEIGVPYEFYCSIHTEMRGTLTVIG